MSTKICAACVDKINDFIEFRELCSATNIQMRISLGLPNDIDVDETIDDETNAEPDNESQSNENCSWTAESEAFSEPM